MLENILNEVRYGFKVTESDGTVLADLKNQKADDGTGIQRLTFEKEGPKDIEVTVEAVGGTPMGDFVEKSDFGIVVAFRRWGRNKYNVNRIKIHQLHTSGISRDQSD